MKLLPIQCVIQSVSHNNKIIVFKSNTRFCMKRLGILRFSIKYKDYSIQNNAVYFNLFPPETLYSLGDSRIWKIPYFSTQCFQLVIGALINNKFTDLDTKMHNLKYPIQPFEILNVLFYLLSSKFLIKFAHLFISLPKLVDYSMIFYLLALHDLQYSPLGSYLRDMVQIKYGACILRLENLLPIFGNTGRLHSFQQALRSVSRRSMAHIKFLPLTNCSCCNSGELKPLIISMDSSYHSNFYYLQCCEGYFVHIACLCDITVEPRWKCPACRLVYKFGHATCHNLHINAQYSLPVAW